jgi:putative redox protein
MSVLEAQAKSTKLHVTYDGVQHCTALEGTVGKMVATDVPRSCGGKGEEFSPIELVGAGLGSCMLLSMGTLALRDKLDVSGATVDVEISLTDKPVFRIGARGLQFSMPRNFSEEERGKLERAAHACPIKPSMHPDIPLSIQFNYPS